jgi:hypothetical protein
MRTSAKVVIEPMAILRNISVTCSIVVIARPPSAVQT